MNRIILICGESGCGKTTIAKILKNLYGLKSVQSYTTRPKRDKNERGHTFVSDEEFNNIKINDIVAYTVFDGYKYCATTQQIEENNIYILDKEGISAFKEKYKGNKIPLIIYLKTSLEERRKRMKKRGDDDRKIEKRLKNDKLMFQGIEDYVDEIVENSENSDLTTLAKYIWKLYITQ